MKIANKTIDYRIAAEFDGREKHLANTTEVSLPDIEPLSDSIKGAGIMGEIDWPSLGQIGSMKLSFTARVISALATKLNAPKAQRITIRWATETIDTTSMKSVIIPHKVIVVGVPKKYGQGKVEKGSAMDPNYEFEIFYFRELIDGKETMMIDKFNNVYKIDGVNYAEAIENAL